MSREWIYNVLLGKWVCIKTGTVGYPSKGDYYSDAGDWRIW